MSSPVEHKRIIQHLYHKKEYLKYPEMEKVLNKGMSSPTMPIAISQNFIDVIDEAKETIQGRRVQKCCTGRGLIACIRAVWKRTVLWFNMIDPSYRRDFTRAVDRIADYYDSQVRRTINASATVFSQHVIESETVESEEESVASSSSELTIQAEEEESLSFELEELEEGLPSRHSAEESSDSSDFNYQILVSGEVDLAFSERVDEFRRDDGFEGEEEEVYEEVEDELIARNEDAFQREELGKMLPNLERMVEFAETDLGDVRGLLLKCVNQKNPGGDLLYRNRFVQYRLRQVLEIALRARARIDQAEPRVDRGWLVNTILATKEQVVEEIEREEEGKLQDFFMRLNGNDFYVENRNEIDREQFQIDFEDLSREIERFEESIAEIQEQIDVYEQENERDLNECMADVDRKQIAVRDAKEALHRAISQYRDLGGEYQDEQESQVEEEGEL